jgi:hypothetical protein
VSVYVLVAPLHGGPSASRRENLCERPEGADLNLAKMNTAGQPVRLRAARMGDDRLVRSCGQ